MSDKPNRHEQRKAVTRQQLIDAARALIVQQGYNNVDILDITERANLSKATFYKHFANKEDCVRALMQQGFDALVSQVMGAKCNAPVNAEWIEGALETVFAWADENRELLLIMVGGASSSQLNRFGRGYMVEVIERIIMHEFTPAELPRTYSPVIQAQVITGILIQLLGWWLEHTTGYTPYAMGEMVYAIIQNGLGSLPARVEHDF